MEQVYSGYIIYNKELEASLNTDSDKGEWAFYIGNVSICETSEAAQKELDEIIKYRLREIKRFEGYKDFATANALKDELEQIKACKIVKAIETIVLEIEE